MVLPGTEGRLDASHSGRARFENLAYILALGVILATALVVLFGIAYPPPAPDTKIADWGASIVSRANTSVPIIMTLLGALIGYTGVTLTRGHLDAAIDNKPPPT